MASDDYEESPDAFHTRVLQIQDVSDTIAIANLQLQKLLSTLGWDRESLTKVSSCKSLHLQFFRYG